MRTRFADVIENIEPDDLMIGVDFSALLYDQGYEDGYARRANIDPGNPSYSDGWWDGRAESEARAEFHGPQ